MAGTIQIENLAQGLTSCSNYDFTKQKTINLPYGGGKIAVTFYLLDSKGHCKVSEMWNYEGDQVEEAVSKFNSIDV